jgi:pyrimidine operon attenuation protein / uracil phosphoribosyltransferase
VRVLLDASSVARGLNRIAGQIIERHGGVAGLVLVGVRRGGVRIAEDLQVALRQLEGNNLAGNDVVMGTVDITLYRDDASSAMPNPRIGPSEIPVSLQGRQVVLVDDVISTGRTVRAALDALLDYGRPRSIELCVVIDRGGRELPVQPDYAVKRVEVGADERVDVLVSAEGVIAVAQPSSLPTVPPPAAGDKRRP